MLELIPIDPYIGLYIKEFRLRAWFTIWQPQACVDSVSPEQQTHLHILNLTEYLALSQDALFTFILPEKLKKWTSALKNRRQDPVLGLLFILCPESTRTS